jgi:hypothetical protein
LRRQQQQHRRARKAQRGSGCKPRASECGHWTAVVVWWRQHQQRSEGGLQPQRLCCWGAVEACQQVGHVAAAAGLRLLLWFWTCGLVAAAPTVRRQQAAHSITVGGGRYRYCVGRSGVLVEGVGMIAWYSLGTVMRHGEGVGAAAGLAGLAAVTGGMQRAGCWRGGGVVTIPPLGGTVSTQRLRQRLAVNGQLRAGVE